MFYLIWYQQEVNQFAVMHPEERFRIFAEMHGIDQVQRNWEESVEKLTETLEMLRVAESNVASKKQWLKIKKTELDRYEDNLRRLREGGRLYVASLLKLENYYKDQQDQLIGQIHQLELDKEQQLEAIDVSSLKETQISNQDSALDEQRKLKVFDLYRQELERKLIILTPKSHESSYLDRYSKAYIVHHDPTIPRSKVTGLKKII